MNRIVAALVAALFALSAAPAAHAGDGTGPAGDNVTVRMANRLGASWRTPYTDELPRGIHAEVVFLDDMNRWVTVVHAQKPKARSFARSVKGGNWYVVKRNRFIIPLRRGPFSADDCADGCVRRSLGDTAHWIADKLGHGWRVVTPLARPIAP